MKFPSLQFPRFSSSVVQLRSSLFILFYFSCHHETKANLKKKKNSFTRLPITSMGLKGHAHLPRPQTRPPPFRLTAGEECENIKECWRISSCRFHPRDALVSHEECVFLIFSPKKRWRMQTFVSFVFCRIWRNVLMNSSTI